MQRNNLQILQGTITCVYMYEQSVNHISLLHVEVVQSHPLCRTCFGQHQASSCLIHFTCAYMYLLVMLFTDDVCSCCYASQSDSDDSFNLTESSIAAAGTAQSKRWVHTNTQWRACVKTSVFSTLFRVTSSLQVSDSDAHHNKPISRTGMYCNNVLTK